MHLRILFDNPALVSRGKEQDTIEVQIVKPEVFAARDYNLTMSSESLKLKTKVRKQLPLDMDE